MDGGDALRAWVRDGFQLPAVCCYYRILSICCARTEGDHARAERIEIVHTPKKQRDGEWRKIVQTKTKTEKMARWLLWCGMENADEVNYGGPAGQERPRRPSLGGKSERLPRRSFVRFSCRKASKAAGRQRQSARENDQRGGVRGVDVGLGSPTGPADLWFLPPPALAKPTTYVSQ